MGCLSVYGMMNLHACPLVKGFSYYALSDVESEVLGLGQTAH